MKRNILGLLTISLVFFVSQVAHAQFEGTFTVETFSFTNNGRAIPQKTLHVAMTPDRILIRGLQGIVMPAQFGGIQSDAILVRSDKKDFIIFSDDKKALQIQKSEIENLINMTNSLSSAFGGSSAAQNNKPKTIVTGETKRIDGYTCTKVQVTEIDKEGHQNRTDVWVTKQVPVNWGILSEPWNISDSELSDLLTPDWLKNGEMPISLQFYQDGIEKYSMKVGRLKKENVPQALISVPAGFQLVSLRQLLMNHMFSN